MSGAGQNGPSKEADHKTTPFIQEAGNETKKLIVGAIMFVAAFAWRDTFTSILKRFISEDKIKVKWLFTLLYTVVVTVVAILLAVLLK